MRAPEPRAFRLEGEEGTIYCRRIPPFRAGDTRYFEVGKACCGCGAWEHTSRAEGELRGRFLPVGFIRHFLGMEQVAFVEILWWWGGGGDQPRDAPCRWIAWSEFMRVNDGGRLRTGILYRVADSRSELVRTWQLSEPVIKSGKQHQEEPREECPANQFVRLLLDLLPAICCHHRPQLVAPPGWRVRGIDVESKIARRGPT